jgi:hypothetical protein
MSSECETAPKPKTSVIIIEGTGTGMKDFKTRHHALAARRGSLVPDIGCRAVWKASKIKAFQSSREMFSTLIPVLTRACDTSVAGCCPLERCEAWLRM